MAYNERGQDVSRAFHEVGHFLQARDCGLAVPLMTIDRALAAREGGSQSDGFCSIPDLHRAPIADQLAVLRAGIIAADMAGLPNIHGGSGDFAQESELIKHLRGDDQRALVARASRRAEAILRDHWKEAEALVERLLAERTIRFTSSTAARTIPWAERRAALDAKHGAAAVDRELLRLGFTHLVTPATPIVPATQIRRATMPVLVRTATRSTSFDAANNTLDVVFTTGEAVTRVDAHGTQYREILETGVNNVDLSRLNAGAPFLDSHQQGLDNILGRVVSARMESGKGLATIKLSARKEVAGAVLDLKDGIITGISTGYKYERVQREQDRASGMMIWRATRWQPYEISACLIQADSGARVRNGTEHEFELRG